MGGENPSAVLYDVNGNALSVQNATAIPASTPALIFAGSDGTNSRYVLVDSSGRPVIVGAGVAGTPAGGVVSIQGVAGGTVVPISGTVTANAGTGNFTVVQATASNLLAEVGGLGAVNSSPVGNPLYLGVVAPSGNLISLIGDSLGAAGVAIMSNEFAVLSNTTVTANGSQTITKNNYGTQEINLIVNVTGSVTGTTPTLQFTITELDPGNNTTTFGNSSTTTVISAGGVYTATLNSTTSSAIKVSWVVTGTTPSFGGVYATVVTKVTPVTQPVSGTISISGTVGVTQSTSPWVDNITQFGGNNVVTGTGVSGLGIPRVTVSNDSNILATQSGTWTVTATQATAANLRTQTASESTTATATGTVAALVGGAVTTASPTYTTGQMDPLSLTTAGALRIDGSAVTQPVSGTVTANQGTANTIANSWPFEITDGTHGPVAVKAASTAAVAADPSLVVGLSPNSPLPTGTNNIGSVNNVQTAESTAAWTSATANNTTLALTVTGYATVTVTLNQTTTITGGAVTFEGSDTVAGTNWYPISMVSTAGATVPVSTYTLVANTNIAFQTNVAGFIQFRVRLSPAISGTGTVNVGIAGNAASTEWQQATFITDGTHGPVAVKAASTAPAFTDQALVVVLSPNQQPIPVTGAPAGATAGVSFGRTTGSANTLAAIRGTAYTEQTTNFTGSVKSTSANDTSAGTGARTVIITYYDQTGAGPNTETVTLNGTTAVNLVNANHCFIEKMVVVTVGSGASNAGTISLFTGAAGAGTTVGSIGVGNASSGRGDNSTLWAHHYTPVSKTSSIFLINAGTTGNQAADISLYSIPVLTANAAEVKISDSIVVGPNSDSVSRSSLNPIKVSGFARTTAYVVANGGNTTYTGGFDYSDQ